MFKKKKRLLLECECVESRGYHVAAYLSWWIVRKKKALNKFF